ncbi:TadE/TadG family type IV pilus assembly protein [Aliivibrio fischeri]|uniref:TadE/TadG family type IV pilus assembly protein n=1 Tax=Aliivibrio fischeri TaxID=668 RepID=UPI003735020C
MKQKQIMKQKGVTIVEFTLIVLAVMVLIIGVLEIGRYVYSLQMMNEMTRKAARLATVCYVLDQHDIPTMDEIVETYPADFSADNLIIEYLDSSGNTIDLTGFASLNIEDQSSVFAMIRFVRARVDNYQYRFFSLLSFIGTDGVLEMPEFQTTLPAESLGVVRPREDDDNSGVIIDC